MLISKFINENIKNQVSELEKYHPIYAGFMAWVVLSKASIHWI